MNRFTHEADIDKIRRAYRVGNPCPFMNRTQLTCKREHHTCTKLCTDVKTWTKCPQIIGLMRVEAKVNQQSTPTLDGF